MKNNRFKPILYDGPSLIDGKPIVALQIPSIHNIKTGWMVQTYIMRSDIDPVAANKAGEDESVCGSCVHRKGSCYVILHQAPQSIYRHYKMGYYDSDKSWSMRSMPVRLGTYGDPAAVPRAVWDALIQRWGGTWTGYTHSPHVQDLRDLCMASVESEEQAARLQAQGWKTYRTKPVGAPILPGEVPCPASAEMGKTVTCDQCMRCQPGKYNIAIDVHGAANKRKAFKLHVEEAA